MKGSSLVTTHATRGETTMHDGPVQEPRPLRLAPKDATETRTTSPPPGTVTGSVGSAIKAMAKTQAGGRPDSYWPRD